MGMAPPYNAYSIKLNYTDNSETLDQIILTWYFWIWNHRKSSRVKVIFSPLKIIFFGSVQPEHAIPDWLIPSGGQHLHFYRPGKCGDTAARNCCRTNPRSALSHLYPDWNLQHNSTSEHINSFLMNVVALLVVIEDKFHFVVYFCAI